MTHIPDWLFAECYDAVDDLAETIALLLPAPSSAASTGLADWVEDQLIPVKNWTENERKTAGQRAWSTWDATERLIGNKLIRGASAWVCRSRSWCGRWSRRAALRPPQLPTA